MSEEENRHNDKLKIWLDFWKFILGTVILGLVTVSINNAIQERELDLKEQEQVGQFLNQALEKDVESRKRFSEYFSLVTRSVNLKKGWQDYHDLVLKEYNDNQKAIKEKEEKMKNLPQNDPDKELLQIEIKQIQKKQELTRRKTYQSDTAVLKSDGHSAGDEKELCVFADSGGYLDPSSLHDNTINSKGSSAVQSLLIESSAIKVCKTFRLLKNNEGAPSEARVNFEIEGG